MRILSTSFVGLLLMLLLTGCGNRVEPNKEGVLMTNYGRSGKADFKAVTGSQGLLWPGSELYQVPMWEQKADPQKVGITAKDGGFFQVDPTYQYSPIRGKGVDTVFGYKHVGLSGQEDNELMDKLEASILNPLVLNAYREEARRYSTDSLLKNMGNFEKQVEARLAKSFEAKYFNLAPESLTSGLQPPTSMIAAIEARNNRKLELENVANQLDIARKLQEKALIDAETNRIQSKGLTQEILQEKWIDAILRSDNRVIITDGKTPVMLTQ